jgi:hypothetical protein
MLEIRPENPDECVILTEQAKNTIQTLKSTYLPRADDEIPFIAIRSIHR